MNPIAIEHSNAQIPPLPHLVCKCPLPLRGYLGVGNALFQYLWKHAISEVMYLESP